MPISSANAFSVQSRESAASIISGQVLMGSYPTAFRNGCQRPSVTPLRFNGGMDTIGERIRSERDSQGISRADLARAAGLSYTALADLERGATKSTPKLHRIAAKLGVNVQWLETEKGPKSVGSGTDHRLGTLGEAPAPLAELWIALDLTARALAESRPDAGQKLAEALETLPHGLPDRPHLRKLREDIRMELENQELLRAAGRPAPKRTARKRQ